MSIWNLFGKKEIEELEEPPPPPPPDSCCKKFSGFLIVHWRSVFSIIWPLVWLPLLIWKFKLKEYRVLYCVCLMAGYWVTECLPLPVTSCIPILYMPVMGISNTTEICMAYFNGTNVMFLTSVMIALAVKHCNLHMRIALIVLLAVGCSPRRLHFGVMTITHLLSWWMQNTACTAMMCPILMGVLQELEKQGMDPVFLPSEDGEVEDITKRRPSHTTIAFFLAAAYGSTTGGCATLVGTDTNLVLRGYIEGYEEKHNKKKEGVNFAKFMGFNGPTMFIVNCLSWVVIQVMWLGLWRPKSKDYQTVQKGIELKDLAKQVLKEKFDDLGRMSWHESWVLFLFITVIFLWFFRDPGFMPGWKVIGQGTDVGDGVACIFILLLMFLIPKEPIFYKSFSKNPEDRPTERSEGLLTWKVLHEQTPWGLMFLLGGGFALAHASDHSKMSDLIGDWLRPMKVLPEWLIMMICATAASFMTELTANVSICNILVPIVLNLAHKIEAKHLILTMPTAIACSFAFCLPSGTPPNALVVGFVNMPTIAMAKTGIVVSIIALVIYFSAIQSYGRLFYDI